MPRQSIHPESTNVLNNDLLTTCPLTLDMKSFKSLNGWVATIASTAFSPTPFKQVKGRRIELPSIT